MDCHFFLQGIFPTQGSNLGLPHCRQMLYRLNHQESQTEFSPKFFYLLLLLLLLSRFSRVRFCETRDGSPSGSPVPGILQGKNTGVGCHFLLQCMKVKSESEVAQSCPTLSNPMDCSLPGSSVHGSFQARVLEWGCHCLLQLKMMLILKLKKKEL